MKPEREPAWHQALAGEGRQGWLEPAVAFIRDGISRGEAVSVGVSAPTAAILGQVVRGQPLVDLFDMPRLGRNPGRIIAQMLDFAAAHRGRPVRYLSEPLWPGRTDAEYAEAARHEALVGPAFSGVPARILCLYDAGGLPAGALACCEQTHQVVTSRGQAQASARYAGPGILPPECDQPLGPPPARAARLRYRRDLRAVRMLVTRCGGEAGLADGRATDLALAASEIAANTLRHAGSDGLIQIWRQDGEVICQLSDAGRIADPLAGRRRPVSDSSGQGLWVVNQVCDLVEVRSGAAGTTVRLHVRL